MAIKKTFNDNKKWRFYKSSSQNKEEEIEFTLRPQSLKEYIGQQQLKQNLEVFISAAKGRKEVLEHMLFYGPPWLWKTTLAMIIAKEMWSNLKTTSGPAIEKSWDLAAILTSLKEWDVFFIDEIHRLKTNIEEILYSAMEDQKLDIVIGKWPWARLMCIKLPKFTLIWATTKLSFLSSPLRDRFWSITRLEFYKKEEIEKIIIRASKILELKIDNQAVWKIANSCRQTPRISNRILKRLRDFAEVHNNWSLDVNIAISWLKALWIDEIWLDTSDKNFLKTMIEKFNGWPVGISTIAVAISEEKETIESVYEPFLIQLWFIKRTPRWRIVTKKAYEYLWFNFNQTIEY